MKSTKFSLSMLVVVLLIISCRNKNDAYSGTGTFEATEVNVSAETMGKLLSWEASEGKNVTTDMILGYIDTTQLHLQKDELYAQLAASNSRYTDIPKQIATLQQAVANRKREQARFQKLVDAKAGNQKQVDDIRYQIEELNKEVIAKQSLLESNNKSIGNQGVALSSKINAIQDMIDKSIIKSPINGVILVKYIEIGEFASAGKALFKVADMDNIFLRAYVTSEQLVHIKIGQPIRVYADFGGDTKKEYPGTITWISGEAEFTPKSIQTDDERANMVYAIKMAVKNDGYIKRGMYGRFKI